MKILLVNQAHASFGGPGGAERSVRTLSEALASRGHDVVSIAMAQKDQTGHMTENGIHSEHLIAGVRTILLGKVKRWPSEAQMIGSLIEREGPDIVHTNVFWHNNDLWKALSKFDVKLVHTLREFKAICPQNMFCDGGNCASVCASCQMTAQLTRARSQSVDTVVGISDFVLRRHLDQGFFADARHKVVIPNSYAVRAPAATPLSPPNGSLRIGFLGRIHPTKGVDVLLDAVLARSDNAVHLTIAGQIQDDGIHARLVQAEGDPRLSFVGFVDPAELFEQIDLTVVPSRWHEPFGRVAIESLANGVPVLASNRGGLPEIVAHGHTGWIYEADDDNGLANALDRALREPRQLQQFRANCPDAARRYRPEVTAEEYETIYKRTLTSRKAAAKGSAAAPFLRRAIRASGQLLGNHAGGAKGLKVLVVTGEFPKLTETFVLNHITGLLDHGVDVSIFYEKRGDGSQWHADVDKYRLFDRAICYGMPVRLQKARNHVSNVSRDVAGRLRHLLDRSSIVGLPPPLDELAFAVLDEQTRTDLKLRLFYAAEKLIDSGRPYDIVHCHFGHRGRFAAELKKMGAIDGKIAVTFHGIDMTQHVRTHGIHVYEQLKAECDALFPVSNHFREKLLRLGTSPNKTRVHHVGVDCHAFRYRGRAVRPDEPIRVLSVGRLIEKKGIEYAIRAFGVLKQREQIGRLRYDIVGDGPEREALEKLAGTLGLDGHVEFHGGVAHDAVARFMAKSHVFLAPSVTATNGDMEGIPTSIMEAMATGMPVLSTLHSGIPELVKDQQTGLLSPERDFKQLADNLWFLAQNDELWPEFGRAGREIVEKDFNIERQNERIIEFYSEMLGATQRIGQAV